MWILTGTGFVVDTCPNKYLPKSCVTMFDLYSIWGGSGKTAKAKVGIMDMVHMLVLTPWACDDRHNGKCLQFSTCCDSNLRWNSQSISPEPLRKRCPNECLRNSNELIVFGWWNEVPKKSDWDVGGHLTGGFLASRKSARFLMTTPSGCFEEA